MVPLNTDSTRSALPAENGSTSGPPYLRIALVGRTAIRRMLVSFVITASARPGPRYESLSMSPMSSSVNGNTAIDRSAAAELTPSAESSLSVSVTMRIRVRRATMTL